MKGNKLLTNKNNNMIGPLLIEPTIFTDERGLFFESWNQKSFDLLINKKTKFVQDNFSISKIGTIRGLHYQLPPMGQGKLIRCSHGKIFDVGIDLRISSPTFGEYISCILSDKNNKQLWLPEGFAHGFLSLSSQAKINYKTTNFWAKSLERTIIWDDKTIQINWPMDAIREKKLSISKKDLEGDLFNNVIQKKNYFL